MYHSGPNFRNTLYDLICKINAGELHADVAEQLGDNILIALMKPDGGTRPIGIGTALRRLAGRVLMADYALDMARIFTTTAPTAEDLVARPR